MSGFVHLARGQDERAVADVGEAADWARRIGEAQVLVPALSFQAFVQLTLVGPDAAKATLGDLLANVGPSLIIFDLVPIAAAQDDPGLSELVGAPIGRGVMETPWVHALDELLAGDRLGAALIPPNRRRATLR
jgi:hypothetical protein